jgi:hypothetical protein
MCYNKQVSITTYIAGMIGCINLYFNLNLKVEAIFFGFVIQMQLIEYIIWDNISCNDTNIITSKFGTIINHMEPIVLWVAILLLSSKVLPMWINIYMIIFVIITIFYTLDVFPNKCTTVTKESSPHLHWEWNYNSSSIYYIYMYYGLFLLTFNILMITGLEYGYHLAFLTTLSFIISFKIYDKNKSVGAMWCFIAAITPFFIPFVYQIKI